MLRDRVKKVLNSPVVDNHLVFVLVFVLEVHLVHFRNLCFLFNIPYEGFVLLEEILIYCSHLLLRVGQFARLLQELGIEKGLVLSHFLLKQVAHHACVEVLTGLWARQVILFWVLCQRKTLFNEDLLLARILSHIFKSRF